MRWRGPGDELFPQGDVRDGDRKDGRSHSGDPPRASALLPLRQPTEQQ